MGSDSECMGGDGLMKFSERLAAGEQWSAQNGKIWLGTVDKNDQGEPIFTGLNRSDRREVARSTRKTAKMEKRGKKALKNLQRMS